jgi:hypothetical protein
MKSVKLQEFKRKNLKTIHIPEEGIFVTSRDKVLFHVTKPNTDSLQEESVAKALEVIEEKTIKLDTFNNVKPLGPQTLGICSRCGRQGNVIEKQYLDEKTGRYQGKYLCTAVCFKKKKTAPGKLVRTNLPLEMRFGNKGNDFGPANITKGTF